MSKLLNIFSGHRPDVTPAQVAGFLIGGIPVIANIGHAFGIFEISKEEQDALKQAAEWGVIGGVGLFVADAHIRGKRNEHDATIKSAALTKDSAPPAGLDEIVESDDEELPSDEEELASPPGEGSEATVKPDLVA